MQSTRRTSAGCGARSRVCSNVLQLWHSLTLHLRLSNQVMVTAVIESSITSVGEEQQISLPPKTPDYIHPLPLSVLGFQK